MKRLLLLLLTSYTLMADTLPHSITTTIKSINPNGEIDLGSPAPIGMSGIVVHDYGNGLVAITNALITKNGKKATLLDYKAIPHDNIPNVKTTSKVNDKVILGNFYNNALLIAPDAKSYTDITQKFKKTWIHPDLFAVDFMKNSQSEITLDNIKKFAKKNQVGLVLIASKEALFILDPISKKIIGKRDIVVDTNKAMKPFFARFKQMDTSIFGMSKVTLTNYDKAINHLIKQIK